MPTGAIIAKEIRTRIKQGGVNKVVVISDFADLNNDDAAGRVLSRMAEKGDLIRLAQGVYLFPNKTRFGIQKPSIDVLATAIAEKDKARIIPSGLTALNALGLSTQVPMNAVYITNGTPRNINITGRKIIFKRACPRMFAYKSRLFAMVVLAMKEIGEKNISADEIRKIVDILSSSSEKELIQQDFLAAPGWIRKILRNKITL